MPYKCENQLLNSPENKEIIVREVELLGNQKPVVNARSLIPMTEDTIDILKIGSRPLGEILFDDPKIERGHLEVGSFQNSWARRSTFTIGKTNLLVTEIFLESLYA
jgi:chorismate--pyruvate lyase